MDAYRVHWLSSWFDKSKVRARSGSENSASANVTTTTFCYALRQKRSAYKDRWRRNEIPREDHEDFSGRKCPRELP